MNISVTDNSVNIGTSSQTPKSGQSQEAILRTAKQFEAVLLMQLTSLLNDTKDENDEDALFGNEGGSGLAKQMFSEQLATTMAESGGIGLSQIIMQQIGAKNVKAPSISIVNEAFPKAMSAVGEIKNNGISLDKKSVPLVNKTEKIKPLSERFSGKISGNINDVEVVSTFSDKYQTSNVKQTLQINGKIVEQPLSQFMPDLNSNSSEVVYEVAPPRAIESSKSVENNNLQMPVNGRISSNFGNRFHPIDKVVKFHDGIDIAAPKGTAVTAAADGIVTFAGPRKGYGNLVIIKHADGKETRYGHADKILAKEGDQVKVGESIATVGSTGKSTGPHVHFEVRENGQSVNPRKFLSNVLRK